MSTNPGQLTPKLSLALFFRETKMEDEEYVDMLVDSHHRLTKAELHLYAKMMRKRRDEAEKAVALRKENARINAIHGKTKKRVNPL